MVGLAAEAIDSNSIHPHPHHSFDANEPAAGDGIDEGISRAHAATRPDRHRYESVQGSRGAPYCVVSVVIDVVNVNGDVSALIIIILLLCWWGCFLFNGGNDEATVSP